MNTRNCEWQLGRGRAGIYTEEARDEESFGSRRCDDPLGRHWNRVIYESGFND